LKTDAGIWSVGLQRRRWARWSRPGAAAVPGFQIHLKFAFCSAGGPVC